MDNFGFPGPAQYRLKQLDLDGSIYYTEPILIDDSTAVGETTADVGRVYTVRFDARSLVTLRCSVPLEQSIRESVHPNS